MVRHGKPYIKYLSTGSWPIYIGFTSDPIAYAKEIKRLEVEDPSPFVSPGADATTHILDVNGNRTVIICIRPRKGASRSQILGLICHEAAHVWNAVCEAMNGSCPGGEHQAYGIQWISQFMAECLWEQE